MPAAQTRITPTGDARRPATTPVLAAGMNAVVSELQRPRGIAVARAPLAAHASRLR
jgi:hypothetical protein